MTGRVRDIEPFAHRPEDYDSVVNAPVVELDSLNLTANAGEVSGLVGPNGAGKSTTIKMLTTLLPPTSGEARVAGFSITAHPTDIRRAIGYVPQAVSVDGSITGYENLLIFAKLCDIPPPCFRRSRLSLRAL